MSINRYPGTKPFEKHEKKLFFGRKADTEKLLEIIRLEPLVLLYSKSGLGKSSLINAGIIPELENDANNEIFTFRFTRYAEGALTPIENIAVKAETKGRSLTDKILPDDKSLWQLFKKRQLQNLKNPVFYLFFDQFEEIFSYPRAQITEFKQQLKELLYVKLPQKFRDEMEQMLEIDPDFLSESEIQEIYKPLKIKVVMAIRSDKMSLLNALADYLPNILKIHYELSPLTRESARQAIVEPAQKNTPGFETRPFTYQPALLTRILDYLTKKDTKAIESFQLQMICQQAEQIARQKQEQSPENQTVEIQSNDIGELKNIFAAHYQNTLSLFADTRHRRNIQRFIETKLIIDNSRMSLPDKAVLKEKGISTQVLKTLTDKRILRSEPNNVGGISYEISHDTLIDPILEAKKEREQAEEEQRVQEERQQELRRARQKAEKERIEREKERRRQRKVIITVGSVAVVAVVAFIFAVVLYFDAQKARKEAEKQTQIAEEQKTIANESLLKIRNSFIKEANLYLETGEYELAKKKFIYLRDSIEGGDTSRAVAKRILKCDTMINRQTEYTEYMQKAKQAFDEQDYEQVTDFYEKALNTEINNSRVNAKLKDLLIITENNIADYTQKAEAMKTINPGMAARERSNARKMRALKKRIEELINSE